MALTDWIEAKTRKPDESEEVFVVTIDGTERLIEIGMWSKREKKWLDAIALEPFECKVTHWMPMPELPKE